MAGIPLHITPLSYIRGSGSQYITTDIYLRSTDTVKSKWRFEGQAGNTYGCYTSGGADDNFCLYAGSQSVNAYIRYNGQVVREFKPPTGTIHELEQGPDGFFDDGVRLVSFSQATFTCSAPMYIFMLPNSTSAKVTARCYGLTVYRDGEQVCNFIPARNELTGEVGFWESVGGVFYENAGTGSFSAGPEVNFSVKTLLLKRRRTMMPANGVPVGLAYYREIRTMTSSEQYLTINHNLGTQNVAVFIKDTGSPAYGTNAVFTALYLSPFVTSPLYANGSYYLSESRTTSPDSLYYIGNENTLSSFATNSATVASRFTSYPFRSGRTYDIVVVALDVTSPTGVSYDFNTFTLASTQVSVQIPNNTGKANVFGFIAHHSPAFYQNAVLAGALTGQSGTVECFPSETRSSWGNTTIYAASTGAVISPSSLVFVPRNVSYPYDAGTYKSFIIEIPT